MAINIRSTAFTDGAAIPVRYTCDGENRAPELSWSGAPPNTRSFALIVDDPDAPGGTFTHWVLFDLPASISGLPEGAPGVGIAGANDFGNAGYGGPCPPRGGGAHRYRFTIYALDVPALQLQQGASRGQVEAAMQGHIVAQGQLMGRYERR